MALGNPTSAGADFLNRNNYLVLRPQYALSYNESRLQPNWVSWSFSSSDRGSVPRSNAWSMETELPNDFARIGTASFGQGSLWVRGHMTPSEDRTATLADNLATFRMSNVIPFAGANNSGLWSQFEEYCRNLANDGDEVLLICGPAGFGGAQQYLPNGMPIPAWAWKIAVEIPNAASTLPASQRITENCRVIAILTPNQNVGLGTWQSYITSVENIEATLDADGNATPFFDFFNSIPDASTAVYLKNVVDTGTGPNQPTVVTSFHPTSGAPGTAVTIWGFHFGATPVVRFGDSLAGNVTIAGNRTLIATVPAGAVVGNCSITVNGTGGIDTAYEMFTVENGTLPYVKTAVSSLNGLSGIQGRAGSVQSYTVSAANLSGPVTITAPIHFEVALSGGLFSSGVSIPAPGGSISGAMVRVRTKSTAPSGSVLGTINHSSPGASNSGVTVAANILPNSSFITLSPNSLGGMDTFQGRSSSPKPFDISGFNLTGNVSVTASPGIEFSLNNINYTTSLALAPVNGQISTRFFVRLTRTAAVGAFSGEIAFSGGGLSPQTLSVSGRVSAAATSGEITWNFDTATPTSFLPVGLSAGSVAHVHNHGTTTLLSAVSPSSGYAGASGGNNAASSAFGGPLSLEDGASTYYEFTLVPQPFSSFTLNSISFATRSTATGPQAYTLRNSLDGFSASLASGNISANGNWEFKQHALSMASGTPATFRLYGCNGTGTGNPNWRIDDLRLGVSTSATTQPIPSITSPAAASGKVGTAFHHTIAGTNQSYGYGASGLPPGLTIHPTTGVISGTPKWDGFFSTRVTVLNAAGLAYQTLNITISPTVPVLTSAVVATGRAGAGFTLKVTAANAPRSFQASGLPAGLTLNSTTGIISGTPASAGNHSILLSATNGAGTGNATLALTILPMLPTITSATSANGTVGSLFDYQIIATQSPTRFSASGLPAGLTINSTSGRIQGTPSIDGLFNATITASNAGGTGAKRLALSIAAIPPVITSGNSTAGRVGSNFAYRIVASNAPRSFAASGLPAGFSLNSTTGLITGVPTATGNLTFTVFASNPAGTASREVALTVAPPVPIISSASSANGSVGSVFSYQIIANYSPTTYRAVGLPIGLTCNSNTGLISGTPSVAGNFAVVLYASNVNGAGAKNLALTISPAP